MLGGVLYADDKASSPFSPLDLSGLVLWLKADAGLYEDAAKAVPATDDADAIYTWADQSGTGHDAVQATAANRPTVKLAIQNGKPIVRFDGVDDYLDCGTGAIISAVLGSTFTLFYVLANAPSGLSVVIAKDNDTGGRDYAIGFNSAGPKGPYVESGGGPSPVGVATTNAPHSYIVNRTGDTAYTTYIDGAQVQTGGQNGDTATTSTTIGRRNYTGSNLYLAADIAEIVAYNVSLSTANREAVEAYLNTKYVVY